MGKSKVLVSICCITFNHDKFIKECLEGFIKQKTNFNYEVLIYDDASTDNNAYIIKEYEKIYPNIIKPIYQKENQFSKGVSLSLTYNFPRAQGKYIAMCEGDDYWTDPLKLQKQVDFLEGNPEYGICFHNVKIFDQANQKLIEDTITRDVEETTDINELAKGNYIHTPSVMLRNDFTIPKWFKKSPVGDWSLYMLAIKDRKIKKLEDIMTVYRVHDTSIWSGLSQEVKNNKTKISINLIFKNVALPDKTKQILRNRLGLSKKKKSFLFKVFKKIKNKIK